MTSETYDQSIDSKDADDNQAEIDEMDVTPAPNEDQKGGRRTMWLELVITSMLALATVGTAWRGYQAARWGGVQSEFSSQAGARRVESVRASVLFLAGIASRFSWANRDHHSFSRHAGYRLYNGEADRRHLQPGQ